jgi:uncharacterized protein (DUF433 family)
VTTINVLEVRYAATKDGPWSEPKSAGQTWLNSEPYDWTDNGKTSDGTRYMQQRVVSYSPTPVRHPGTEPLEGRRGDDGRGLVVPPSAESTATPGDLTIDRDIMGGLPCVAGHRITIAQLLGEAAEWGALDALAVDMRCQPDEFRAAMRAAARYFAQASNFAEETAPATAKPEETEL